MNFLKHALLMERVNPAYCSGTRSCSVTQNRFNSYLYHNSLLYVTLSQTNIYTITNLAGDSFGGVVQGHELNVGLPA